ncbi:MAG: cyaY [Rickettsiaceae bacterium]|jgi:iron donor protein CyaY|nr:cyaY [Rickettsiaceae bacterium]
MSNIIASEKDFLTASENELIGLADIIENSDKNSIFDVEYSDGILNIIAFASGQQYVINKHSASRKIWFSSPISGADYFSYSQGKWLNDKGLELKTILLDELKTNFKLQ